MDSDLAEFANHMRAHGITPPRRLVADGKIHRFATSNKPGDKAGGYVLHTAGGLHGAFWDWRTDLRVSWGAQARETLTVAERQALAREMAQARQQAEQERDRQRQRNARVIGETWNASIPITTGDPVHAYLKARRLELTGPQDAVRYHPALAYWHQDGDGPMRLLGHFPAMVAAVEVDLPQSAALGCPARRIAALHRTYLTPRGGKAKVPQARKLTGTCTDLKGGAIRLAEPQVIDGLLSLGVAEGIETALAAAAGSGVPCWSAVSAAGMRAFQWPRELRSLFIFADNDESGTGQAAAADLSARAMAAGLTVRTLTPLTAGQDWADVWAAR